MKRMAVEKLDENLDAFVAAAPREMVLLTRKGKPFAVVRDASNYDEEDIGYINDPGFWKMIAERQIEPTIPLEAAKRHLLEREKKLHRKSNLGKKGK